jgi:hypothetical protein
MAWHSRMRASSLETPPAPLLPLPQVMSPACSVSSLSLADVGPSQLDERLADAGLLPLAGGAGGPALPAWLVHWRLRLGLASEVGRLQQREAMPGGAERRVFACCVGVGVHVLAPMPLLPCPCSHALAAPRSRSASCNAA